MLLERAGEVGRRPQGRWAGEEKFAPVAASASGLSRRLTLYEADEEILMPAAGSNRLFQVACGVVRICTVLNDGRRTISAFHFPGEVFGFEPGGHRAFRAEAVDSVGIRPFALPEGDLRGGEFLRIALARLAETQEHLLVVGRQTASERIAAFLLDVSRRQHEPEIVDLPMPRTDIADYLGLTPETVCRVFKHLRDGGLIDFTASRRVTIKSSNALGRLIA
ncbi:MAG TPA: helix-turn-helix domain-containing protein [Devosiaceae bacterium]|jgi:CRP/FNR family nitrogen fixation transcriptional regulator